MAFDNARAVTYLAHAFEAADDHLRVEIMKAMAQIHDRSVIPELRKFLQSDGTKHTSVIEALGNFGDPEAIPDLIAYYRKLSPHTSPVTLRALGKIGHPDALKLLGEVLGTYDNPHYREDYDEFNAALEAIQLIGTSAAIDKLEQCFRAATNGSSRTSIQKAIAALRQSQGV